MAGGSEGFESEEWEWDCCYGGEIGGGEAWGGGVGLVGFVFDGFFERAYSVIAYMSERASDVFVGLSLSGWGMFLFFCCIYNYMSTEDNRSSGG